MEKIADEINPILKSDSSENCYRNEKVTFKLLFSGIVTTFLPLFYGIGLLSIQALDSSTLQSYKVPLETFFSRNFSILFFAAFISNILFFFCHLESRAAFIISSLSASFGFFLSTFVDSLLSMYVGRFFIGFSAGIIASYLPCYLSLISPIKTRGIFSSLYVIGLVGGLLVFNILLSYFREYYSRIMSLISLVALLHPILLYNCIPFGSKSISSPSTILSLLVNPKATRSLFIVALFHIIQNLCGINQMSLNPESIYGPDFQRHVVLSLLIGWIVSFIAGHFIEILGRKVMVLLSCSVTSLCCLAFYFQYKIFYFSYLFSFGFNLGLGCIPYIILGEIFPEEHVAAGALFGTSCNWIGSILSVQIPQGDASEKYNVSFLYYIGFTMVFSVFIMLMFKECKGKQPSFQ